MPAAHQQKSSATWLAYYPDHAPRSDDPHYSLFEAARAEMIKTGQGCWRCRNLLHLEAHHAMLEFAVINGIDLARFHVDFPSIDSIEELREWAAGPGNLEILCRDCHRGVYGVHSVPYPAWVWARWAKDGIETVRKITA